MGVYQEWARKWWDSGYCPIPINPRNKAPLVDGWQDFSEDRMTEDQLSAYLAAHPDAMIGLVMGTVVREGWRIVAIDVDDDDLVESSRFALGNTVSAKRGMKGVTYFARMPLAVNAGTRRFKRLSKGKKLNKPSIELLGAKSQTVIPPSIHPETKQPYDWVGKSLLDVEFDTLPVMNEGAINEIAGICDGTIPTILALNAMTWLGVGKGGDTHDTCLAAVGLMVRRGWSDEDIFLRVRRGKQEACARGGESYNWPDEDKIIGGWISDAKAKGYDKQGEEARAKVKKPIAERLMSDWATKYLGGEDYIVCHLDVMRRYHEGHWPTLDENLLRRVLCREFKDVRGSEIEASITMLRNESYKADFGITPNVEVRDDMKLFRMCLTNGTLNLKTGRLERHRAEDEILHQLKFDWDDSAGCPVFDKFIVEMFQGDQTTIDCVMEYMAYTLVPDNSFQKFMVLIGTGGNGKGTLTRLWQSLFDPNAISSVNVASLNNERMVAALVGKLLNISSEQSRFDQMADTQLKQITGNDPITTRKLYKEAQNNQRLYVRFLMQVNEMPSTSDSSDALGRRVIIINCPNQVIDNPDLMLDKKLIQERAGVLRKYLIPALNRLYANNKFSEPPLSVKLKNEWLSSSENVLHWLNECCIRPEKNQDLKGWENWSPSRDLYMHYSEYCKTFGFKFIANEIQWGTKLKLYGCDSVSRHVAMLKKNVKMRPIKLKDGSGEY